MTTSEVFSQLKSRLESKVAQLSNSQGVYQFNLTGEDSGTYFISIADGVLQAQAGTAANAGVTITMQAADFKALAEGSLNPMTAFMSGKLSVAGDMNLALKLQTLIA